MTNEFRTGISVLISGFVIPLKVAIRAQHNGEWMLLYPNFGSVLRENICGYIF